MGLAQPPVGASPDAWQWQPNWQPMCAAVDSGRQSR